VPSLPTGKGAELGQKHFQHPKRTADDFGPDMDRFSFIVIDLSLRALAENPGLFSTHSNGENIIFAAGDFLDPGRSSVFGALKSSPRLARDAANFAAICFAGTKGTPSLSDFLAGQNIPSSPIVVPPSKRQTSAASRPVYVGAYDVLNAASYSAVAKQVGNKVELVGIVTRVHLGWTRQRRPYCFIFFDNSRQCVKLNIWSNGLGKLTEKPTEAWVGKWLSVQGLVDPAFSNKNGTSLSITVDAGNQIRQITQAEAQRRLRKPGTASAGASSRNQTVLAQLNLPPPAATTPAPVRKQRKATRKAASAPPAASTVQFKNQAILTALQQGQPSRPAVKPTRSPPPTSVRPSTAPVADVPWGWIVFGVIALLFFLGSLR
jgi:hypothetical protein